MFLDKIDDRSKVWKFRLIDNVEIIGTVENYAKTTDGHPIMLWIWTSASVHFVSVPWASIVFIEPIGE